MTAFPGPAALGRGIVVTNGGTVPDEAARWPHVVLGPDELALPRKAADELHLRWLRREPVVVELAVDADELRQAETSDAEPYTLDPDFDFARERLQCLVWSNNYDGRSDAEAPIWWHARRAERLGAAPAGDRDDGEVLLPDGTPAWCDGGPRGPLAGNDADAAEATDGGPALTLVHRDSIEAGSLPGPTARRRSPPARPRPAARRRARVRPGPHHRPGRLGQDPRAHRAPAPSARRPGRDARLGARRGVQQAGGRRARRPHAPASAPALARSTPSAWPSCNGSPPGPARRRARARRARGPADRRDARHRPAPGQHRPVGPLPRGARRRSGSAWRPRTRSEEAIPDAAGRGRACSTSTGELCGDRGRRLRRADLRRDRGAARRPGPAAPRPGALAATCSSTSSRTSPRPTCCSSGCSPPPTSTCSAWATTTRSSTATPGPTPSS